MISREIYRDEEEMRLLRLKQLIEKVGMKKTAIYDRMARGDFPKPISLGGRSVAWIESEIDEWINARKRAA